MSQNQDKINQLKALFPEAVKDGKIDYDALKKSIKEDSSDDDLTKDVDFAKKEKAKLGEKAERIQIRNKIIAGIAAAIVTLLVIHYVGLLGFALFGLIAAGIIKG